MSARWKVMGLPLEKFNESGAQGEPFGVIEDATGKHIILTKQVTFFEGDEPQSSVHHPQMERERG